MCVYYPTRPTRSSRTFVPGTKEKGKSEEETEDDGEGKDVR